MNYGKLMKANDAQSVSKRATLKSESANLGKKEGLEARIKLTGEATHPNGTNNYLKRKKTMMTMKACLTQMTIVMASFKRTKTTSR